MRALKFKQPVQERSAATVERIISALEAELRTRSFDEISINDLTTKAGVSTGSFYARFPTKAAVLPVAYDRFSMAARTSFRQQIAAVPWKTLSLREKISTALKLIREDHANKRWLKRAMHLYARMHPEGANTSSSERSREELDTAADILVTRDDPVQRKRAALAFFVMTVVIREHTLFGDAPLARALDLSPDDMRQELGTMVEAYLSTRMRSIAAQ